jgi:transcriptional regulator with XRE-family HTH domain
MCKFNNVIFLLRNFIINFMSDLINVKIRQIREVKNITRDEIAENLGMSISGYGKIERGEVELTLNKLLILSNIFNMSVDEIINFNE